MPVPGFPGAKENARPGEPRHLRDGRLNDHPLQRVHPLWIAIAALVVLALVLMLAVSS